MQSSASKAFKSDSAYILTGVAKIIGVVILIAAIAINWSAIECWVCDRFDWLPRDVALTKIRNSSVSDGVIPVKVTGIQILGDNQRKAEFDYQLAPPKESPGSVPEPVLNTIYHSDINFQRYDDGWRVVQAP